MDTKALQLLSRFALSANCPTNVDRSVLEKFLAEGGAEGVEAELKKYKYLYSHLRLLAELLGKPEFSYEVATAYIFGNSRLKVATESYERLLEIFAEQGVAGDKMAFFREHRPTIFQPNHLQHVLGDVAALGLTGGLAEKAKHNCMVSLEQREEGAVATHWGKVIAALSPEEEQELKESIRQMQEAWS
jgi:hypothetical protein